jgi:hypothetical protein
MGTADAGHYYSIIQDREKEWLPEKERWYEFNDTLVGQYNPEEIKMTLLAVKRKIMALRAFRSGLWKKLGTHIYWSTSV